MKMMEKREKLGSRFGFIMLSAGCAIGCGNVWKFPWMCGQSGGGFMIIYLLCLLVLGLPIMTMELSVGRAAQKSPVKMYQTLQPKGKWGIMGYICLVGNIILMTFYMVVAGWLISYFVRFVTGNFEELGFAAMISNPNINVFYLLITVILAFGIISLGLQGGVEKITKAMMSILILLILVLAVRSFTLSGALEGLKFYLVPDFSKIDGNVIVNAMNQAFFTLSVGMGSMAIFGSYIDKERTMMGESATIIVLDTFVAFAAGLIIFPACFTYNVEVGAGPSLLFDTMATVFRNMDSGRLWGSIFFLFMVFAAMSTVIGVCENILAMVRELTGWSRRKGSIICSVGLFVLALTTALGFSVFHFQPFATGTTWLDFWDFLVSNNILPLGSLVLCIFCCFKCGWNWDNFVEEANTGIGPKVKSWMKPIFCYAIPVIIGFIYIWGLIKFQWR